MDSIEARSSGHLLASSMQLLLEALDLPLPCLPGTEFLLKLQSKALPCHLQRCLHSNEHPAYLL